MKILLGVLCCFGLVGCGSSHPRFKPGDCVARKWDTPAERWEHRPLYKFSSKIVEVGQLNYRTLYWYRAGNDWIVRRQVQANEDLDWVDHTWVPIDCKSLMEIK